MTNMTDWLSCILLLRLSALVIDEPTLKGVSVAM